jgi:hypothetical protein
VNCLHTPPDAAHGAAALGATVLPNAASSSRDRKITRLLFGIC